MIGSLLNVLEIQRTVPFTKYLYFKAETLKVSKVVKALLVVCGQEKLVLQDPTNDVFKITGN